MPIPLLKIVWACRVALDWVSATIIVVAPGRCTGAMDVGLTTINDVLLYI